MKILILHQYYLRPGQAGGARFNVMARSWAEAGHEVCVIAGQVHYTQADQTPARERAWLEEETQDGVRVWRVSAPTPMGSGALLWSLLGLHSRSFGARAQGFVAYALAAAWAIITRIGPSQRPDLVISSSPSLLVLVPGFIAQLKGARHIFEVRDLWPESAVTMGVLKPQHPVTWGLSALERLGYLLSDATCALTPAIAQDIKRRAAPKRLWVFPNGAEIDAYTRLKEEQAHEVRARYGFGERFVAMYAGAHGLANGLEQLIEVALALRAHPELLIVAIGDGPQREALMARTRALELDNLWWLSAIPYTQMPAHMAAADAGLVILRDVSTFRTVYPNKLFEVMAAGRPVISNIQGQVSALLERAQAGVSVQGQDTQALAAAILGLAKDRGRAKGLGVNGRAYVMAHFNREQIATDYLGALSALVGGS